MPAAKPGMKVRADPSEIGNIEDKQYTVADVARIFEVNIQTARAWCNSGELVATKGAMNKKSYQISRESLVAFATKRYIA